MKLELYEFFFYKMKFYDSEQLLFV